MIRKFCNRLSSIVAFACLFLTLPTTAFAVDSYVVNNGTTLAIDEFGVCKEVTNNAAGNIMVPTKTANEWHMGGSSFLENLPPGVTAVDCPPSCSGVSVGGYCWYLGALGQSCDAVCYARGGANLAGTRNYVGSGGTLTNCQNVADALGIVYGMSWDSYFTDGSYAAVGCIFYTPTTNPSLPRMYTPTTTTSATHWNSRRICACNN